MANKFQGFRSPKYTPVPNELFDEVLSDLTGAELKVLMYIIRKTFGWQKDSDNISLNQLLNGITSKEGLILDRGTGLSKKTLLETIKSLVEKNLIITERRRSAERGDEPTTYRLHILDSNSKEESGTPRGVESTPGGVEENTPGGSDKNYPSQETVKQQTDLHFRNSKAQNQEETKKFPTAEAKELALQDHTGSSYIQNPTTGKSNPKRTGSLRTTAEILVSHQPPVPHPAIPSVSEHKFTLTPQIQVAVDEISAKFGDTPHLKANITQAINIWQASGHNEAYFVHALYEARSVTKQQRNVRYPIRFFWTTVRDLVGLKKDSEAIAADPAGG